MKKRRSGFLFAIVSLILCVAMISGATYAWFIDKEGSNDNKIQAGTLDVDLMMADYSETDQAYGEYYSIGESTTPVFNYSKWEPGYSVGKLFKIVNKGNVALKYTLGFDITKSLTGLEVQAEEENGATNTNLYLHLTDKGSTAKLENSLRVYVSGTDVGTLADVMSNTNLIMAGKNSYLKEGESVEFGELKIVMPTTENNKTENAAIEFDIRLYATQYTYEYDGFGSNQYDADSDLWRIDRTGAWYGATNKSKMLENTDKTYITVLTPEGQPTDIFVLETDGTYKVGSATVVVSGTDISYKNTSTDAQNVVIRTNLSSMKLTVDDASSGKIYHYGYLGNLKIIQCHTNSFYENGKTTFVEFSKGRIVLTEYSDVDTIFINKKDDHTYNNPIIADGGVLDENMPEIISRDQVSVTDARGMTELVQVQVLDANGNVTGNAEQVYAYANGTAGTTEKTATQNTDIITELGIIVLDSGNKPGEKAYDTQEKIEAVEVAEKAAKYGGGRGTPEDPYLIYTVEHLKGMSADYVSNTTIGEYCNFECYKLMNDITVENWTIATIHYIELSSQSVMPYCNAFGGQFDGNGHTIKFIWDSNVTSVDGNDGVSLFGEFIDSIGIAGYDRPGVMKNLTIDCDIDADCDISPMFAYIWGDDSTVENCHIKGTIKTPYYTCGVSLYANVGENLIKHLIKDCTFDADVIINVKENDERKHEYIYVSTFVCQTTNYYGRSGSPIIFENCEVNGSITIQYCKNITEIYYGTFYASNNTYKTKCPGTNCVDNCTVNIAQEYYDNSATIVQSTLKVPD